MSAPHASSDDEFQDDLDLDEAQFDSILADAQTQVSLWTPLLPVLPLAQSQLAPPPSTNQHSSSDEFSDDEDIEIDPDMLAHLDHLELKYATQQQQLETPSASSAIHAAAPSSAALVASSSIHSRPGSPRIATPKPAAVRIAKTGTKRARTAELELPLKRVRTSSKDKLDSDRESNEHETTIKKLIEELECPICSEHIVHPHSLNCGHSACAPCLDQWLIICIKTKKAPSCPVCRQTFPESTIPPPAYMILNCAQMMLPHLDFVSQACWREKTDNWKHNWGFKALLPPPKPGASAAAGDADSDDDDDDEDDNDYDDDNSSSNEDDVIVVDFIRRPQRSSAVIDLT